VWWLARRWELSHAASWTAAAGFALSGALVSSTAYPNLAWPAAWMPWALLAQEAATAGGSRWAVAALSFIWFAMVSMGDPIVFAATVAGQAVLHARTLATRSVGDFRRRAVWSLLPLGAAALLAMLLALPLIVAIARYLPASVRGAGFKESGIVQWSLHPALLAELALPEPYGNAIAPGPAGFWATGLAADRGRPLLAGLYVGGLLLALSCLGAVRRTAERTSLLMWLVLLVALALGKFGPIYPIVGDSEWFDSLRYPAKWIVPAMLPLALLAGSGVDFIGERLARDRSYRTGAFVFLGVLVALAAVSIGAMSGLDRALAALSGRPAAASAALEAHIRDVWVSGATWSAGALAAALVALVLGARARNAAVVPAAIAALVTLDLALANPRFAPTTPSDFYRVPAAVSAILDDPAGHGRVFVDDTERGTEHLSYVNSPMTAEEAARPQRERLLSYVGASAGLSSPSMSTPKRSRRWTTRKRVSWCEARPIARC
jgi:hypothetical protein